MSTTAGQIMTPASQRAVAAPEEDVADVLTRLAERDVGQLPVLRGGRFVGILRQRDIARWLELRADGHAR